ncbi:MarR family transcriptional regulator [Polaribacter vadi]|uniref:MarR family winged helix-turn-helix transcriptional regulator n=1 Tax=Polaribacter TaxID=52959 RepID=UPI001C09A4D9|nr:MarR family transcriptional regulator [Polaribacter sp. 1_MG-2023]MBU3010961.1 MarR family transcriptional regulator [Polaribacter vadi]MDO6740774.1 MarR family transcriptional regulator [Polaribacter sp. 1_MG-2023]
MKTKKIDIDFENSIGPWLGRTGKMVDYFFQESFNAIGLDLTKEQMIVLKKLTFQDGLNQNELAFLTLRNKSSLTRLLTKMEKKNYIFRKQSKEDKRIKNVYLTKYGKDIYNKTKPVIQNLITTMEQNISKEEKQQIIKIFKKIQTNFSSSIEHI